MDLSNIKLVGLDLDGTLLHDDKGLSPRSREAIKNLHKKGIEIVPITGRPYAGVPDELKNMQEIDYIISNNGSYIMKNGEIMFNFAMDKNKASEILGIISTEECMVEIFSGGWGYIEQYVDDYYHTVIPEDSPAGEYIYGSRRIIDSLDELMEGITGVDEIFVICLKNGVRENIVGKIKSVDGIQHWNFANDFVEITKKGTDKGTALAKLCEYLGIDSADTIAFGDGENDLPFLDTAGVAVAMGNATDVVKAKADIVTLTNNEDGVAKILENI